MSMSSVPSNNGGNGQGARGRAPGWYYPWIYVACLGVVAVVNGIMIYFATSTFNGLETEDHFIKGIQYNQDLAGARAQAERGWQVATKFEATDPRKGVIAVTLHDKHGNLLQNARVSVTFIRPTVQGHDVTLDLPYLGEGRYGQAVDLSLSGVWDLRVRIDHSAGDYQDQQRIWVN